MRVLELDADVAGRVNHKWSDQDVFLSFIMYRMRIMPTTRKFRNILDYTDIPFQSMDSAFKNYEYLDGIGNYNRYSKSAERLHRLHRYTPLPVLVEMVEHDDIRRILESRLSRR
jgi:hypothetical protein